METPSSVSSQFTLPLSSPLVAPDVQEDVLFAPGSLLGGNRYRISGKLEHQQWTSEIYETCWKAQDLLLGEATITICELGLPEMRVVTRQAHLRAAMKGLFKAGVHARIPTLVNVFREGGRDFFVFDSIEGETLHARIQRTRQPLQEREVITGCLQIIETLEASVEQDPPLIHGLISPEHVIITPSGQWALTGFSVVLASGIKEHLTDLNPSLFTPFTDPEFAKGIIDSRSDLYGLLATAYFALTGRLVTETGRGGSLGQYSQISPSLDVILKKGLHPTASQRYQQISVLHQDLLALSSMGSISRPLAMREPGRSIPPRQEQRNSIPDVNVSVSQRQSFAPEMRRDYAPPANMSMPREQAFAPEMRRTQDPLAQVLSSLASPDEPGALGRNMLPHPEELPPMHEGNDMLAAVLWLGIILACLLIPVFIK